MTTKDCQAVYKRRPRKKASKWRRNFLQLEKKDHEEEGDESEEEHEEKGVKVKKNLKKQVMELKKKKKVKNHVMKVKKKKKKVKRTMKKTMKKRMITGNPKEEQNDYMTKMLPLHVQMLFKQLVEDIP